MKEKLKKIVNKNLKFILILGIVIVLAMGMLLMLISGNDDQRDQVPVDPNAGQEEKKEKKERKLELMDDHPGVSDLALALYNTRVEDMSDTAEVAQLIEASDMREELGSYLITLDMGNEGDILVISFEKELLPGEGAAFDEAATWYAEQFLALIEEADAVKWTYKIEKEAAELKAEQEQAEKEAAAAKAAAEKEAAKEASDKKEDKDKEDSDKDKKETKEIKIDKFKVVEKSLTVQEADELLGTEVKGYSKTPELVQTLLNNQKGIV